MSEQVPTPGGDERADAAEPAPEVEPRPEVAPAPEAERAPEAEPVPDVEDLPGGARAALEAVLMVVDEPVDEASLAVAVRLPVDHVHALLVALEDEYAREARGFELRRSAGGWRVYSRADLADVVARFVRDGQTARLTQAALETLAIIAYRQPVSRARVSAVRGVDVDGVVRTLVARGLVVEQSKDPATGAMLYGTTPSFLERMGLASLDELPPLAPFLPEGADLEDLTEGQL